jgi:hypothetical protein
LSLSLSGPTFAALEKVTLCTMKTLAAIIGCLVASSTMAESAYDWRSGNRYSWDTDLRGDTHVRGYNLKQQPLRLA